MTQEQISERLNYLADLYERAEFIENDPISIPHSFSRREDIEIAALFASTIAWGNRKMILRNARSIIDRMDGAPYDFVIGASDAELCRLDGFVHRTFNDFDLQYFVLALRNICLNYGGIGQFFETHYREHQDIRLTIAAFRSELLGADCPSRTSRHVSDIAKGSAAKRVCMMLRWMVRSSERGVDFGLWNTIPASALYIPLDVHAARQGRALGLLERKSNDWRAVEELTATLRIFDPSDPVRYDFALFGFGVDNAKL